MYLLNIIIIINGTIFYIYCMNVDRCFAKNMINRLLESLAWAEAPGLLASQLEALEKTASNSDIFGCNGGPGRGMVGVCLGI